MADVTWAKFAWNAREETWVYCGMTPHDELAAEFTEANAEEGVAAVAVSLEAPSKDALRQLAEAAHG